MKNKIFYFIFLLLMITAYAPSALRAADISVGATTWYTNWETSDSMGFELKDPVFLYGPVMAVKFSDDWSFTLVFLYGQFNENVKMTDEISGMTFPVDLTIDRYDSDAALNYRLNNYLKIFAGIKYMGYMYNIKISESTMFGTAWFNNDFDHKGVGPGGGLSGVFPLGYDFYILGNISAMYLWGKDEIKTKSYDPLSDITTSSSSSSSSKEYGINTGISLTYYIPAASTSISLGGRFQEFTSDYESGSGSASDNISKFWGATLSATYTFSI